MGIAASQAILLYLTRRIVDVEFQAQQIQMRKIDMSTKQNSVYQKYLDALDATTLTYRTTNGENLQANFTNLCGLNSINNSLASSKKYVFRSSDDKLIVPTDVYEGYEKYDGDDPYEFAMYMLGADVFGEESGCELSAFEKAQQNYFNKKCDTQSDYMRNLRNTIETKIKSMISRTPYANQEEEGQKETIKDMMEELFSGDFENFKQRFFTREALQDPSVISDLEVLQEKMEEYKSKLYKSGAKDIYAAATGTDPENFDKSKFDYYLYWGKLIQMEAGLDGCDCAGFYGDGFETNADTLNNMLLYGQISIESVELNNSTGKISEPKFTTVSSETSLSFVSKSEVDATERKKAEAEYNKALQEIQREEKLYDMELANLETERQELTAEVDTVKTIIKEAVERSFKIFS